MSSNSPTKRKAANLSPQGKKMTASGKKQEGGLELFGIKPSKVSPSNGGANKDSYIRMAVINDENEGCVIVYRFEPKDTSNTNGSWSEKVMFESLRNGVKFVRLLNVHPYCEHLFINNEPVVNGRGYKVRMFQIMCENRPQATALKSLATRICDEVNAIPGNNTTASIEEGRLMWLPEDAVWSDAVGVDRALEKLFLKTGQPDTNYYHENHTIVHTYFHPETFSLDLARALRAPVEQVHPDLRADLRNNDGDEDSGNESDGDGDYVQVNNEENGGISDEDN